MQLVCRVFFFQAEDGIRDLTGTGVQTCALPISRKFRAASGPLPPSSWARRFSSSAPNRSEEHTSELQSQSNLVCRLLLEKKKHTPHPSRPRSLETDRT